MSQEQPRSSENLDAFSTQIPAAAASGKVFAESAKRCLVYVADGLVSADCPMNQMFRGSKMAAGCNVGIAILKQVIGERFEQCSGRTTANGAHPRGCHKESCEHYDLLDFWYGEGGQYYAESNKAQSGRMPPGTHAHRRDWSLTLHKNTHRIKSTRGRLGQTAGR